MLASRRRSTPRRSARRGFTLVEVLVALTIVGLAAVAAISAFATELRTAGRAQRGLEAAALAEERLAGLAMLPVRELGALPDSLERGRVAPPFEMYDVSASVRAAREATDLYDVTVRVAWESGGYEMRTRLYRPPRLAMP